MIKKLGLYFIALFIFTGFVNAEDITISKQVVNEITLGESVTVIIKIINNKDLDKQLIVKEKIPPEVELVNPLKPNKIEYFNGIEAKFFQWNVSIPARKVVSLEYTIKPISLGIYTISPTTANNYESQSFDFKVICNPDNICSSNENYEYCPEDCTPSKADGICNPEVDSICDPDCNFDPDCKEEEPFNFSLIYVGLGVLVLLVIIIFLVIRLFKRKPEMNLQEDNSKINKLNNQQTTIESNEALKGL